MAIDLVRQDSNCSAAALWKKAGLSWPDAIRYRHCQLRRAKDDDDDDVDGNLTSFVKSLITLHMHKKSRQCQNRRNEKTEKIISARITAHIQGYEKFASAGRLTL